MNEQVLEAVSPTSGLAAHLAADQAVLESIPAAVYVCAADGVIVRFNSRAAELWGREPRLGDCDEKFCGSFRLYDMRGRLLPHAETPMAMALRTGRAFQDREVTIERPDGSRIIVAVNIKPLKGQDGQLEGAINCFQDITWRKQLEEELRASRSDLEDYFEQAPVGMHWVDHRGTILRANQAELELLGFRREEYVGRQIADFHVDEAKIRSILASLSRGERLDRVPARLRAKDGSIKHVLISSSGRFRDGELVNTRCVTLDITADKQAELSQEDQQRRFNELLEALPMAVYTCDAAGRVTYYNEAAASFWGYHPQSGAVECCGSLKLYRPDGTTLPHDQCPMAMAIKENRALRGVEVLAERPDGARISFLAYPTPLHDASGQLIGAVNVLVDISERKRGEEARQKLASIVENSQDAIVSKDLDGNITSWNQGAERLFGYAAGEVLGQPITLVIPPERQYEELILLDSIRRGEPIIPYDTVRRRKDGSFVQVSLTVAPVKDAEGRVVGASKIARDITARVRAELALAHRMNEQAALFQFADRLQRAESLDEICNAALDSILRALQCQRASILLFDEAGVMRFVAWRGLSDEYRRATEGHSPWTRDVREPRPICVEDIRQADFAEALRAVIEEEGIGALAFIPLVAGGQLVGKFMAYYDAPHAFSEDEVDLAWTVGHQLGFGVERIRTEQARRAAVATLRESEARERADAARLQATMDAVPAVIWIARDAACREIYGNRFASELLQVPPDRNQSLSAPDGERPRNFQVRVKGRVLAEDELPVQRAARGEEIYNFEEEVRFADGTSRHLFGNAIPLYDMDGEPGGAVAAFVDISDRKRAEQQRDLLVAELNHRVKNTLAIVSAIAQQSFSRNPHADEDRRSFFARIRALAQTHSRLAEAGWSGASLEAMLRDEFAPFIRDDRGNVHISGPPVTLQAKCALTLGMSIHELATNAAKYGALSTGHGSLAICWQIDAADQQLRINWAEAGGPKVRRPERSGFGRFLLERALSFDLGGDVRLVFAEEGVQCNIAVPLEANILPASLAR
jgi:PAS domain S-box-containing protein